MLKSITLNSVLGLAAAVLVSVMTCPKAQKSIQRSSRTLALNCLWTWVAQRADRRP